MSVDEKYSRIIEGIAKLDANQTIMKEDIRSIKNDIDQNTKDLAIHIAGVQTAQARLDIEIQTRDQLLTQHEEDSEEEFKKIDDRLKVVEFIPNLAQGVWKVTKWLGVIAAPGVMISKFFGLW